MPQMIKEIELLYYFTQATNSFQSQERTGKKLYKSIYTYIYIHMENMVTVASRHGIFRTSMYR